MAQMQKNALFYSPGSEEFYFDSDDPNCIKIHRTARRLLPGGNNKRVYAFSAEYPAALNSLRDFKTLIPEGVATKTALVKIQALQAIPDSIEALALVNALDYKFKVHPYMHQLVSLEYMLHFRKLALVLEMGLGKTFISVHYLDITKQKAVVFAPVIVLETWMSEIDKFTNLKAILYRGTAKQRAKIRTSVQIGENKDWDVIVTNFEAVVSRGKDKSDYKFFKELGQTCTIIDEASRLLGHKSQRAQVVEDVASCSKNRYLLSGTLSKGKPTDIFMPFKIMDREILGTNYWHFTGKYCKFSPYNKHAITGYKNLDVLKEHIDPFMLCLKRDDCLDMPDRDFVYSYYTMSKEQRATYDAIKANDTVYLPLEGPVVPVGPDRNISEVGEVRCGLTIVKLNKLQQILSGFITLSPERDYTLCNECPSLLECMGAEAEVFPWDKKCAQYNPLAPVKKPESKRLFFKENPKLNLLAETLQDLGVTLDQKTKVIIWVYYKSDIELIKALLIKGGIPFVTPDDKDCERRFREEPDLLVFLGQVSKGIGITLNEAKVTINYSYSLELEHRSQSLDRNYRIGQNNKVMVRDFLHLRSVESGIITMLNKKEDVKEFMQTKGVCKDCDRMLDCLEMGIKAYTEECKLFTARMNAEKKEAIKIE